MSAPPYVPQAKSEVVRSYSSPPRRPDSWTATRPGEVAGPGQPRGVRLGHQGPDQGFILKLARQFQGTLSLRDGEREEDALAGCMLVALKRASLFGRAPVVHDLRLALTLFGFVGEPPPDLVEFRRPLFEQVANPHHYVEQRHIVDVVPDATLRLSPQDVAAQVPGSWRALLSEVVVPAEIEVLPAPSAEPEPVAMLEPAPEAAVDEDAEPLVEASPDALLVADAVSDKVVEPEPEPEPVVEREPVAVAAPEPEPEPVVAPEPEPVVEPEPVAVAAPEPEPVVEPEPVAVAAPEPEPEPVVEPERAPAEAPEPTVTVADLVTEAKVAHGDESEVQHPAPPVTSDPEVRARAIEAAARSHRERGAEQEAPATSVEVPAPTSPAQDGVPRKKVVKRVKKIKKVVKKRPAGAPGPDAGAGGGPQAKPAEKPGSLFGRTDEPG